MAIGPFHEDNNRVTFISVVVWKSTGHIQILTASSLPSIHFPFAPRFIPHSSATNFPSSATFQIFMSNVPLTLPSLYPFFIKFYSREFDWLDFHQCFILFISYLGRVCFHTICTHFLKWFLIQVICDEFRSI